MTSKRWLSDSRERSRQTKKSSRSECRKHQSTKSHNILSDIQYSFSWDPMRGFLSCRRGNHNWFYPSIGWKKNLWRTNKIQLTKLRIRFQAITRSRGEQLSKMCQCTILLDSKSQRTTKEFPLKWGLKVDSPMWFHTTTLRYLKSPLISSPNAQVSYQTFKLLRLISATPSRLSKAKKERVKGLIVATTLSLARWLPLSTRRSLESLLHCLYAENPGKTVVSRTRRVCWYSRAKKRSKFKIKSRANPSQRLIRAKNSQSSCQGTIQMLKLMDKLSMSLMRWVVRLSRYH